MWDVVDVIAGTPCDEMALATVSGCVSPGEPGMSDCGGDVRDFLFPQGVGTVTNEL